ncbi:hypothetical protein [Marivirga sp.]|uniref:hypothetical protein n=1 Tax=Marivirga sp. TaxID=2018662 RepID=UPI002D7EB584|nr:hypothetical protein [Marivirga sp.]HET8859235.1 hypothetical protein [Marivirga sp.]
MSKFTTQELDLASDPTILLIKYRMMEKVWDFLEEMQEEIRIQLLPFHNKLPKELNLIHGKISKGENYKRLPFMMLDFPAFFTKEDILAFRTMFYWGNFISSTFHLQGKFMKDYGKPLIERFRDADGVYFCVNNSPWEYDYKSNNYVLLKELRPEEIEDHLLNMSFIKLSIKFPVEKMPDRKQNMINFLLDGLKVIQTN